MIIFILVCVLLSKFCRQCRRLNIMQAVLFIFCCVFILSMTRLTKCVFLFLLVFNSFSVNYCASREPLQSWSTPVKMLMFYVLYMLKLFRQNVEGWCEAGLETKCDHKRKNSWQDNMVLEKCSHKFCWDSRSHHSWSNCTPSKPLANHGNKWQQMNWCLPSVLPSHHGMFCHLMATAGAPLIAKERGEGTVAVLHKKVAYKSPFLMDTQKPLYLFIVVLVSCVVNNANSDIILILNIKASWFSKGLVIHILLANRTLHTFLFKSFQTIFF